MSISAPNRAHRAAAPARSPERGRPGRPTGRRTLPWLAILALVTLPAPAQDPVEGPPGGDETPESAGDPGALSPGLLDDAPEEGEDAGDRTYLASSLSLGTARDDGFLVRGEELDDTVYLASPSLLLHVPGPRSELTVAYEPEVERFERHPELDAVHHAAGVLYRYDATRRSRLIAGGSLLDGEDPGRQLGGLLLVLPRVPYRQWRGYAGFEHSWQKTELLLYLGRTATRIEAAPGLLAAGLDEAEDEATLTLDHTLGPRTGLTFSYSYLRPTREGTLEEVGEEDDPLLLPLTEPRQTAILGLSLQPGARVTLHLAGGVLYERDEASYLAAGELLRSGRAFSFRLRYERAPLSLGRADVAGGDPSTPPLAPTAALADTVSNALTAGFVVRPVRRLRWEQVVWGARADLPTGETLESVAATSRLVVQAARRLGVYAQADFFDQTGSAALGGGLSRTRYTVGLILGVSGPPAAWGLAGEPHGLATVLPDGRGEEKW